jgi:hypothetical protein
VTQVNRNGIPSAVAWFAVELLDEPTRRLPMMTFEAIACEDLHVVCGGQNPPQQTPPPRIDGRDVLDATGAAVKATLNPLSLLGNVPDAVNRVTRTDRVGNNVGDRLLDGFTGLFGIDPLKPRR